jgi:type III secretory pathway component EscS
LITIVGLGATFIFTENIHWQENLDYGYDKENLLTIQGLNAMDKSEVFVDLVEQHPKVVSTGISWKMLGIGTGDRKVIVQGTEYYIDLMEAGPYYLETNKVRLVNGRFWNNESETDMIASALVNKKFLEIANITDPLNEKITLPNGHVVNVIGVIEDYKQEGPWEEVQPTVIHYPLERVFKFLAVRGKSMEDLKEIDEYCKYHWESLEPHIPYLSFFESFEIRGAREINISYKKTFLLTAIIALLLSVGGMYSLITMLLQKRTKEIAIRKSIGSNIQSLLIMMSKPYMMVAIIAGIIGSVVGIYAVTAILDDMYDYHVKVKILWYVLAAIIMFLVTVLTISTQTIRAASANPVQGLRYE